MIFSGGVAFEKSGQTPTITVIRGSSTTVLEMEHPVVDFVTICSTPWNHGRSCDLCCGTWTVVSPVIYADQMYPLKSILYMKYCPHRTAELFSHSSCKNVIDFIRSISL